MKKQTPVLISERRCRKSLEEIITKIKTFDKRISPEINAKKCMFRIYRDVRFSKDKRPYKNNLGASVNPKGKKTFPQATTYTLNQIILLLPVECGCRLHQS